MLSLDVNLDGELNPVQAKFTLEIMNDVEQGESNLFFPENNKEKTFLCCPEFSNNFLVFMF